MSPSSPVRQLSTAEEDILALERALRWQATPRPPWDSLAGSLALHLAAAVILVLALPSVAEERAATDPEAVVQRFIPLVLPTPTPPKPAPVQSPEGRNTAPVDSAGSAASNVKVNLSSIQLSFALDVRNQLPAVVESQHGMLALLDKEDLGVARYLMQPPGWKPRPTITDVSRRLRFRMEPARKWPVFRDAAERYGVDIDRFVGCAVFDAAFARCLKAAISRHLGPEAMGQVASVQLAFAADHPCGIEVLDVSLAGTRASKR